jgi:signal transduction histidine kinase
MVLSLLALRRTRREQSALAQARDAIAQRASVEAQLHQAKKLEALGLLTAGFTHDFNNMMTVVVGNLALLQGGVADLSPSHQRLLAGALAGCERAAALTKRLLGFAHREPSGHRPVEINEVVTGMSDLPWRSGDQITTMLRLSDDLWPVFVDPTELENALLNLTLNARDAMEGRGILTIKTVNCRLDQSCAARHPGLVPGDYASILIGDTGCGMPPEIRERAFDPFFTTKQSGKGSGLGLSQVYGFVTRSGGHCTIASEPGQGTTVKLVLPRYCGAAEGNAVESHATPRNELHGPALAASSNLG